jgi:hypothetical protein
MDFKNNPKILLNKKTDTGIQAIFLRATNEFKKVFFEDH